MERKRVRFTGTVQGVGFRATAQAVALRFDVTGWVRNEPDGAVLMEAQGPPPALDAFIDALKNEMDRYIDAARIDHVEPREDDQDFRIRL